MSGKRHGSPTGRRHNDEQGHGRDLNVVRTARDCFHPLTAARGRHKLCRGGICPGPSKERLATSHCCSPASWWVALPTAGESTFAAIVYRRVLTAQASKPYIHAVTPVVAGSYDTYNYLLRTSCRCFGPGRTSDGRFEEANVCRVMFRVRRRGCHARS